MRKKNRNGKCLLITGGIAIITMMICALGKDAITRKYFEYKIGKEEKNIEANKYYLDDNFEYINDNASIVLHSKKGLTDFFYYAINSGNTNFKRVIAKDYDSYKSDIAFLTMNEGREFKELVSTLNNFVHPFNSSNNIKIEYGSDYILEIIIQKEYTDKEIKEINNIADKILKEKVDDNLPIKEKIKVIHDYIIDNTSYDVLKDNNKDDDTYRSETAYGVLLEGYGTCNGYADAMAIFLDKLNVINYKISNDEHIWNLVFLDGKWYHLDLTWDDPKSDINVNRDTYFLISTKELEKLDDDAHFFDKNIYKEAA